jgi:acetylglutamate kinase
MKVFIKLGGTLLENPASRVSIAAQIAELHRANAHVVVVHGGGKQMTRYLEDRAVPNEFVDGLRVSSPAVIDAVLKVFAGTVNHELVATLVARGAPAAGLTGIDAKLTECELIKPELGQVGRPIRTNPRLLDVLCDGGFLPVVACVGGDSQGNIYNVNGDQMAASLAAGWRAAKVLFLTDVEGVRDADSQRIPVLRSAHARELMSSGVASGGMRAKLRAAQEALDAGVAEVRIVLGSADRVIARVLAGEDLGTSFVQ